MDLIERNGVWWPANDTWCHKVIDGELSDIEVALRFVKERRVAIQAGGNVGVWATYLAKSFARVITVEPDETNYECLKRNVPKNVEHHRAGFGNAALMTGIKQVEGNAGAHYLKGQGDIHLVRIDDLELDACDLLILDVEGFEPMALEGAEQTIRKYRPVVMFEEKGLSQQYYGRARGSSQRWVRSLGLGYNVVARERADIIMAVQ